MSFLCPQQAWLFILFFMHSVQSSYISVICKHNHAQYLTLKLSLALRYLQTMQTWKDCFFSFIFLRTWLYQNILLKLINKYIILKIVIHTMTQFLLVNLTSISCHGFYEAQLYCSIIPLVRSTYQNLGRWFGDGWQYVDTLGGEVSTFGSAHTLAHTPARVHHRLPVLLYQHNQVSLLETEERRPITWK